MHTMTDGAARTPGTATTAGPLVRVRDRLSSSLATPDAPVVRRFDCCDTTFRLHASGWRAERAADRAERRARALEARLNAFDEGSAVAELNRTGSVTDEYVAAILRRGLAYRERTDGAFDVTRGSLEHGLKSYLRGERDAPPESTMPADVAVDGATVTADAPLDLNGLAKGYIVDRTAETLAGLGRRGFVDGGGDLSSPTGPVAVESPYGDDAPLVHLETSWNVATSAGYRRTRDGVDHLYDPRDGRLGSRHDSVTVVAERDCMEADALATTAATLPLEAALAVFEDWDGAEALVVHAGVFHRTTGFEAHVA